jgi:hypothetical protein
MDKSFTIQESFVRTILDAIPLYVLVTDHEMRFVHANRMGRRLLGDAPDQRLKRPGGEALHCFEAAHAPNGCGSAGACQDCVIRKGVQLARVGAGVSRQRTRMQLLQGAEWRATDFLVTTSPLDYTGQSLVLLGLEDMTEVLALRRLLPICAGCKKIRNDNKYWEDVAHYLSAHTDLRFTHGLCPDCVPKYFPGLTGNSAKERS